MSVPRGAWLAASLAALAIAPQAASAAITPARTDAEALALAKAIAVDPSVVTAATFTSIAPSTPDGDPAAISDTPLGTFPRNGDTYAILTTGDAKLAADPNDTGGLGVPLNYDDAARGANAHDPLTWKIHVDVPADRNCLVVRFRFLSEEFPEFVGSGFNDAFTAELDQTTWVSGTADNTAPSAPDNFAFDEQGNPITINATGVSTANADNAAGTTYDGATRRLAAAKAVTPGAHDLYLSIFDQGDYIYDSAALVDDLQLLSAPASKCTSGAFFDDAPPNLSTGSPSSAPEPLVSDGQSTKDSSPTFGGKAGTTLNDDPEITGVIFSASSVRATPVNGTPVQTKKVPVAADGSWTMTADALPDGAYVFQASQGSSNGQSTVTDPVHFSVDTAAPAPAIDSIGIADVTRDTTPALAGGAGQGPGDAAGITVKLYAGQTATGAPVQTLTAQAAAGRWAVAVPTSLKDGAYTAVVEQGDAAGNTGSGQRRFLVTTKNPIGKVKLPKRLSRTALARAFKGSLKSVWPGKLTFTASVKIGAKTLKLGSVTKTLAKPGKASFAFKPKRTVAKQIKGARRGTVSLKIRFVDDQGRSYTKTQKVSFR